MSELTLISPSGDRALLVSPDAVLRVFDLTAPTAAPRTFREKAHLAAPITAAAWSPAVADGEGGNSSRFVAVGREDGLILVWDVARGEVVQRLGGAAPPGGDASAPLRHSSAVSQLYWGSGGATLLSCAAGSPLAIQWDAATGRAVKSFSAEKKGACGAVASSSDGAGVFLAHTDIHILSAADGAKSRKLRGHALPVKQLAFWPGEDRTLLSVSDEPHVCVWDSNTQPSSTAKSGLVTVPPAAILQLPSRPLAVSLLALPGHKKVFHVAAVGEGGSVFLWRYKCGSGGSEGATAGVVPAATISVAAPFSTGAAGGAASIRAAAAGSGGVLAVQLVASGGAVFGSQGEEADAAPGTGPVAVVVVGPFSSPSFHRCSYSTGSSGRIGPEGVVLPNPSDASSAAAAASSSFSSARVPGAVAAKGGVLVSGGAGRASSSRVPDALTDGAEHIVPPFALGPGGAGTGAGVNGAGTGATGKRAVAAAATAPASSSSGGGGPTLAQTLASVVSTLTAGGGAGLPIATSSSSAAPSSAPALSTAQALTTTGSLAVVVQQALAAGDDAALEQALSYSEARVVRLTVERLPPPTALALLARLVDKLQAKATRGDVLGTWIKALVEVHVSYLLSTPDAAARLRPLAALLDQRCSQHARLAALDGRLQLLLSVGAGAGAGGPSTGYERNLKRARRTVDAGTLQAEAEARALRGSGSAAVEEEEEEAVAPQPKEGGKKRKTAAGTGARGAAQDQPEEGSGDEGALLDEDVGGSEPSEGGSDTHLNDEEEGEDDDDDEEEEGEGDGEEGGEEEEGDNESTE